MVFTTTPFQYWFFLPYAYSRLSCLGMHTFSICDRIVCSHFIASTLQVLYVRNSSCLHCILNINLRLCTSHTHTPTHTPTPIRQISNTSGLLLEEQPARLAIALQLFLQGLGLVPALSTHHTCPSLHTSMVLEGISAPLYPIAASWDRGRNTATLSLYKHRYICRGS